MQQWRTTLMLLEQQHHQLQCARMYMGSGFAASSHAASAGAMWFASPGMAGNSLEMSPGTMSAEQQVLHKSCQARRLEHFPTARHDTTRHRTAPHCTTPHHTAPHHHTATTTLHTTTSRRP